MRPPGHLRVRLCSFPGCSLHPAGTRQESDAVVDPVKILDEAGGLVLASVGYEQHASFIVCRHDSSALVPWHATARGQAAKFVRRFQ